MDNTRRLVSLDAFRGATIAAMVLVNDPGSDEQIYSQLKHASWNGCTFTDWIFPFFLFIVGVSMTFSFAKRIEQGTDRRTLITHIIRRAVIIFLLGLWVNGFPFWFDSSFSVATLRIPGVLQRIAVCYLAASFIFLKTRVKGQTAWILSLLASYWLLVKLIPVPGYGAGLIEPKGNLVGYIDSALLAGHTWVYAPAPGFDPEGILSTLPALATTLIGVVAGQWIRSERPGPEKTSWMFVVGMSMAGLGLLLDMWLPLNKNMWTSSYVVYTGGWGLMCLGFLYWLVDVKGYAKWTMPCVILGMNAIAIYVIAENLATLFWIVHWPAAGGGSVTLHEFIYNGIFAPLGKPADASLLFAVAFVLLMYILSWLLWRRRWFLRV